MAGLLRVGARVVEAPAMAAGAARGHGTVVRIQSSRAGKRLVSRDAVQAFFSPLSWVAHWHSRPRAGQGGRAAPLGAGLGATPGQCRVVPTAPNLPSRLWRGNEPSGPSV
jgi:hypothetical protein